ncbi:probable glutathione S-transferase [Phoenix dactylifera]|uniref:glutathione transferase n=1 Tax=Phoenix dactylifera TaxID=42345 RepID=A0A8B7C7D2_PHODC|nr:probable glutathione S-transferase [Phoenix dactylifera]
MAEEVKLLGSWGSPFSRRVELALRLKGISYDYIEEDLSNKSPLLLKYNPIHKKVPVFLHGGKPVVESLVILEYIEETWEGDHAILPKDPYERAMARFWSTFVDEKCIPAIWMSCWTEGDMQQNFMIQSKENLSILEGELKGKKFFGGDAIGMVDIAAFFIAHWAGVLQEVAGISLINEEKHPILFKWIEEFMSSSIVMECLPAREGLLAYFQAKKEAIRATKAPVY